MENWREMELNEWMWMQGEVVKIFRMPEGPDSGFQFYANAGKRIAFFDTTPMAHAVDEPCYIVEPHAPGGKLVANGLPIFPLAFENDDDGERKAGSDSRVLFTAPADGEFVVRVRESRGFGGERFTFRTSVRQARPDFAVTVSAPTAVNEGSGAAFSLIADRKDGFDGEIVCEISGVPERWMVTSPVVIQAGHLQAKGSIFAMPGAAKWSGVKINAMANLNGMPVTRTTGGIPQMKGEGQPPVVVSLQNNERNADGLDFSRSPGAKPAELALAPGATTSAWIVLKRGTAKGALRFDVENLPHGVVVDNLGLSGITLLEGQNAGEIFIKAAAWVPETERLVFAVCRDAGKQASLPMRLRIQRGAPAAALKTMP